jgi:hypothetical protein
MTKVATIASLVRTAAKQESDFVAVVIAVFEEAEVERIWEFFDRMNIPRSQGAEGGLLDPLPSLLCDATLHIWDFQAEHKISKGVQRYLDRHERKIKWHATHPSIEGTENVLLLFRAAMAVTELRLQRLKLLLHTKDEITPIEWHIARELMNRSYLSFRNFLNLAAGPWVDAVLVAVERDQLSEKLGNFYELVDAQVRLLEDMRGLIEDRRMELTVIPEGYPPVNPPKYFGGDLMGRGPWKQFWTNLNSKAHHFRESVG